MAPTRKRRALATLPDENGRQFSPEGLKSDRHESNNDPPPHEEPAVEEPNNDPPPAEEIHPRSILPSPRPMYVHYRYTAEDWPEPDPRDKQPFTDMHYKKLSINRYWEEIAIW